jgi:lipopolysaccharide biosynthesis glycosyltransferase
MHHIALVSDAATLVGLAVTGYSALKYASRPLCFWLVLDGVARATQRRLADCWDRTGNLAGFHVLPFGKMPIWFWAGSLPPAVYIRLRLASMLPPEVDRYVCLDSDLLVGRDLCELLATDLGGRPAGMARFQWAREDDREYFRGTLGLDPDDYYQAGVMLVDAAQFRERGYEAGLMEQARRTVGSWFNEQDALNAFFRGRIYRLDPCWNVVDVTVTHRGRILHYAGSRKPWDYEPGPDTPLGVLEWQECLRESGFVPPPAILGRLQRLRHRLLAKPLRFLLRRKHQPT